VARQTKQPKEQNMTNTDYKLPAGWTWETVKEQRKKWDIKDNFYPIASVSGVCVAWGTIAKARGEA
jgi:hypothetical protein